MSLEEHLGLSLSLTVVRFGSPGAFLAKADATPETRDARDTKDVVLLLGSEIPEGAQEGQMLDVFLYRDSEGRLLATTRKPYVELGQVAFLRVLETSPVGAFVDWGLAKDLLVPFAEQTQPLTVGARHAFGVYLDEGTNRLAGTMRVSEMLRGKRSEESAWKTDEWVPGEAWRFEPEIGLFVILERRYVGLVPKTEPHSLARGEAARFRVCSVLPDGKVELSLRGHAHEELANDAAIVLRGLERLQASANPTRVGDKSSPETLRDEFGLSKKAFKRAAGRLLKERAVTIDAEGFLVVAKGANTESMS